jgi:hypothetical protein
VLYLQLLRLCCTAGIGSKSFQGHDVSFQYCECGGSDWHTRAASRVGYLLVRLADEWAVTICHCKDTSKPRNVARCLELGRIL